MNGLTSIIIIIAISFASGDICTAANHKLQHNDPVKPTRSLDTQDILDTIFTSTSYPDSGMLYIPSS